MDVVLCLTARQLSVRSPANHMPDNSDNSAHERQHVHVDASTGDEVVYSNHDRDVSSVGRDKDRDDDSGVESSPQAVTSRRRRPDVFVGHLVQLVPSEAFGIVRYVGHTR